MLFLVLTVVLNEQELSEQHEQYWGDNCKVSYLRNVVVDVDEVEVNDFDRKLENVNQIGNENLKKRQVVDGTEGDKGNDPGRDRV